MSKSRHEPPDGALPVKLKLDTNGGLSFRRGSSGAIPIGSYAEFQLISADTAAGTYKQEADPCYNTGVLSGSSYIGGLVGDRQGGVVTDCWWKGQGTPGVGNGTGVDVTFSFSNYFNPGNSGAWGTGDGSGSGKYWKAGINYNSQLPRLWFE